MCWWRCWCSASSFSRSANSSTASTCITSKLCARAPPRPRPVRPRRPARMDFLVLLGSPLLGALALGFLGDRRRAPELNVLVSLVTLCAACMLTLRVVGEGNLLVAGEQFFIDPFNVFLVTLTALVGFTTSLFSRP